MFTMELWSSHCVSVSVAGAEFKQEWQKWQKLVAEWRRHGRDGMRSKGGWGLPSGKHSQKAIEHRKTIGKP